MAQCSLHFWWWDSHSAVVKSVLLLAWRNHQWKQPAASHASQRPTQATPRHVQWLRGQVVGGERAGGRGFWPKKQRSTRQLLCQIFQPTHPAPPPPQIHTSKIAVVRLRKPIGDQVAYLDGSENVFSCHSLAAWLLHHTQVMERWRGCTRWSCRRG